MKCRVCGGGTKLRMCKLAPNMRILSPAYPESESYLVACEECGSVFVDLNITQKEVTEYYQSDSAVALSYYEVYGEKDTDKYFADILDNIKSYISKEAQIIDVASGVGDFSCFLMKNGYENVSALDCSRRCINILRDKKINNIESDTMQCPPNQRDKYDMAVLIHSIEHYLDFDKVIYTVKQMLKDDGYIYIEVPDADEYCQGADTPYTMFTYEHLVHFNLESFENIARAFGLRLKEKGKFYKANSYHVIYCVLQKGGEVKAVKRIESLKKSIMRYNEHSAEMLRKLIEPFEESQESLILWGIGASTASMLDQHFDKCNVHMLVDRNSMRQGIRFKIAGKNYEVKDPRAIMDKDDTIVVLPFWYKDSICQQIKSMGLLNKVVPLS